MKTTRSKDGTILAYDILGAGPPLIYVTGATCFRTYAPILEDAEAFAAEFTVYNYDRRGRGDSGDMPPYAIAREVEDIEAMIDAAGGKAHLYGHSSGAVLALEAAARFGDKIERVVIYDPSYVHDEAERLSYDALSRRVHALLDGDRHAKALRTFLTGIGMPRFFAWLMPLFPGWKAIRALAPTLAYDIALTKDLPPVERVAKLTVPVQIVTGEKSPTSIHHVADQLAKAIPGARLERLAGQDHMVSAKTLLPILSRFLKQSSNRGAET